MVGGAKKTAREQQGSQKLKESVKREQEVEEETEQKTDVVNLAEVAEAAHMEAEAEVRQCRLRCEQLEESEALLKQHDACMREIKVRLKEEEEWTRLMRCDGLPDPHTVPELTRYLSLWTGDTQAAYRPSTSLTQSLEMTKEMITVINDLESVMDNAEDATENQQRLWKEIWLELQLALRKKLDEATYDQLLDLRPHLDHDTTVYSFYKGCPLVSLALWSNTSRSLKNHTHKVEELGFMFSLPPSLLEKECVLRIMRTEYDHYSKFARTFSKPCVAPPTVTLLDMARKSLARAETAKKNLDKLCYVPVESVQITKNGDEDNSNAAVAAVPDTAPGELNLRRQRVQGGVWTVDLVAVPPQPRVLGLDCTVKQVEEECTVSAISWESGYQPPAVSAEGVSNKRKTPQDLEQETRLRERELQKLVLLSVKLPSTAFWFEPPHMVLWNPEQKLWTSDCFHDVKYIEEQSILQVRTSCLGVMGLAMNRFSNLPFQNWELQPAPGETDKAELMLVGAVMVATFTIGKLQTLGINLFPDDDTFRYMDGLPVKERATEHHAYFCMALMATSTYFSWSRWNLLAGLNNLVFQMKFAEKEVSKTSSEETPPLVLVTPSRAMITECNELSQAFSVKPLHEEKFFADLYHLAKGEGNSLVLEAIDNMTPLLACTINTMISRASVLSYC